nr:hypothetical protein [Candidatus Sigynarchaeota archaeon]
MRKLPACITCAKSDGMLCESCQQRLESGELSDLDLDISEILLEIEETNPDSRLAEASFYKSIELDKLVILVIGKGETDVFKPFIKKLQKELQLPRIEFIEKAKGSVDLKSIINDFVQPGKLLSINTIFLPTGDTEYKARVQIRENDKLPLSKKNIEKLIHEITDKLVRIEIEQKS